MSPPPPDAAAAAPLAALDDPIELARFTRLEGAGDAAVAESTLQLAGLHCAACAGQIEAALMAVDGVLEAQVHYAASRARVRWQPGRTQASALVRAVRRAGYDAVPDTLAAARALRAAERRGLLWRLFVAAFCAMQVMMLATPVYVADPGTLEPDLAQLLHRSAWTLTLPVMLFSAAPFFASAWRSLRSGRLGMDVPVALGIAVAFVASSGAAFDPGGVFGHEVYFDSLTMFVSFLLAGRWLEARARHRASEAIEQLAGGLPAVAWRVAADGRGAPVSAQRLAVGDRVRVPVGEAFPADGTLEPGAATEVDESLLTGESRPVPKAAGAAVVAGSGNRGAPVLMRVERVGADTRCEQIAALMREALTRRPEAARLADRWAGPFLAAVLLLALGAAAVWQQIDPSRAVWVAVSVLIVTCPCALALATPAALLAAASSLARRGVLLRRVEALEVLARTGHVMLDKTGTVTEARPMLREARPLGPSAAAELPALLDAAAGLAAWSTHPLSRALHESHADGGAEAWQSVAEVTGCGLEATDAQGRRWRLGRPDWLGVPDDVAAGAQVCFGPAGDARLALHFDEALREDAAQAVRALQAEGVRLTLLSGDAPARVERLAQRLGIAEHVAAATPECKLEALRAAQAGGRVVAMVGDGVNDAPVLAQADASFALAHGAEVARGAADAVLLSGRLGDVVHALRLSRRTVRVMRQNLAWAALYNAACVPLALAGWLPPWAAGLGMAASSMLVVGNAMRLSRSA
jgi:Cu2+-exporting ATPase